MADALVWQLIRENNSFLVKRGRTRRDGSLQFSSEPGNLLNVNTHKYSGIANASTTDVSIVGNEIQLVTKVCNHYITNNLSIHIVFYFVDW